MQQSQAAHGARVPSQQLLTAALGGLLAVSLAAGCNDDTTADAGGSGSSNTCVPGPGAGGSGAEGGGHHSSGGTHSGGEGGEYNNVLSEGVDIPVDEFKTRCEEREGVFYVTAYCAGTVVSKGIFLLGDVLTEHSCKGMNGCGGMACVELPEDSGLSGKEIYEDGPCSGCHASWDVVGGEYVGDFSKYNVVRRPGTTEQEALERFNNSSDARLLATIVFGVQFHYDEPDGLFTSNMPAYHSEYSREEIRRVVEHIKTLEVFSEEYAIFGSSP